VLNQGLVNAHTRHFTYLQRVGTSEFNRFLSILDELQEGILARLPGDLTDFSRARLNQQLKALADFQTTIYDEYLGGFNSRLSQLSQSEAVFEASALRGALLANSSFEVAAPAISQILSAVRLTPLAVGSNGAGKLLKPFIGDWKKSQIETVNGIIRQGWAEGQTINQMASGVKSSISGQTTRTAQAIVRTSINHASQMARSITWEANDDLVIGWRFWAVLDSRTSQECSSIASMNKVYPLGRGPLPPRHPNCRSTTVPELNQKYAIDDSVFSQASKGAKGGAQVSARLSYYDWMKTQPREYVLDTLGPTRGKALLSGKLSSTEFARFNLNARFEPLTIEEMIAKDKKLNLGLFG
jgi:SPP1 gp7 family putative phage head morphogenesis protein